MVIPISTQELKIGDRVITTREFRNDYCIITIGHEFDIVDYNKPYDRFICEDKDKLIIEFGVNSITKKVSLEQANIEHIFVKETKEYKGFIFRNCPNRGEDYDERDPYDSCKLKKRYGNECTPTIECAKYLTKDNIKSSVVLLKHLRLSKIKKINK